MNHYETVFILNPVLSEDQIKETVKKYEDILVSKGAKMIAKEDWGLKKLAYPIQNKKSGFYHLFEFTVAGESIEPPGGAHRSLCRVGRAHCPVLRTALVAAADRRRVWRKADPPSR